ncbi:MAG: amidohydrolase [Acidobacteriales bacterium]|nr:amidohydrolase [Terriglobales bacterium]
MKISRIVFTFVCTIALALSASSQTRPTATASAKPAAAPAPSAPVPIAIRGGKLLTITHGVIENGVVVIEGGKIIAVGAAASVTIPRNAHIIEAAGMTVYPGMIDSMSHLGLTEISAVEMTNDMVEASDEIMPHMHVTDAFHAESELIPVTRMNGVTNAIVSPSSRDTLPGQMAFIQLDGRSSDEMLLVRDISMPLNFTGQQRRNESFASSKYPSTRMGMAAQLRQAFIDAQDYAQKWDEYNKKSADATKDKKDAPTAPKRDLKLEALVPYLQGKKPVLLTAEEPSDIKVAMRLAKEFNLKAILGDLVYSRNILDEIAASKLPVIVGSIYDAPKGDERYDTVFSIPAELQKRGVKIAFGSWGDTHNARNIPYAAGYAVAYGLPWDEALKAVTLNAAEIWGLADKLGSLDVGKTANLVISNGDPLDMKTDVKRVFINGREIPMRSRQTDLRDAYSH